MRKPGLPAVFAVMVCLTTIALGDVAESVLRNGGFVAAADGQPQEWSVSGSPSNVTQQLSVLQEQGSAPFARLTCTRFKGSAPDAHAMLVQKDIPLKRGQLYEFSAQVRASDIRGGAVSISIRNTTNWSECGLNTSVAVSDRWTLVRRAFKATQDTTTGNRLQIWYTETGTLDMREAQLVPIDEQTVRFTDVVPAGNSQNLVRNGSFECGAAGWSSFGVSPGWGNLAFLHGTIEKGSAAQGDAFLRMPIGPGQAPELLFDYGPPDARGDSPPHLANLGWIPVQPGTTYTLSCQLRASERGLAAAIGVVEENPGGGRRQQRKRVDLTSEWSRHSFSFRPQYPYAYIAIGPELANQQTAHVDVDCIQLEQGEQATAYAPHTPVELVLTSSAKGGISYVGETASLEIRVANAALAARYVVVHLEAKDFYGKVEQLPERNLSVPAGGSITELVTIPPEWRGYYEVSANVDGAKSPTSVRLAIVPKRENRDSICGMNHAFADGRLMSLADAAGVSWYRDWSLKWQNIEPSEGKLNWEYGDRQIGRVLDANMKVLPLLPPFPSTDWNSEAPATLPTKEGSGARLRQAWAPRDPDLLAAYIAKAVERYKDRINTWEFLNEPLYTDYALPADDANKYDGRNYAPADYVNLLALASKAMKSSDPNCRVIGGLGGGPLQNMTRELFSAGLLEHLDILNLHMYPGLRAPEAIAPEMDSHLALMDAHGGRKPIWITEFSYYGTDQLPRDPFIPPSWNWSENRLLADERQCADYTIRYFLIMLSRGVERIFIHSGNSGEVNRPSFECAIFAYGGAPRKLFPALANLTGLLGPSPKSAGSARIGDSGWAAAFETEKQSVVALWAPAEMTVALPERADLTWMDLMGRQLEPPPHQLSTSPIYLIAPSGQAASLIAEATKWGN